MRLRNFLSYGESTDPLDFDSIHLACLSGNNGNGKSALLDAILWALWGQSRASGHRGVPQERLINHGKSEMEVELRFDIGGQTYLVFRRLEMRGGNRSPRASLSLSLQGDEGFIPIGGDSVREVQRSIDDILQIDHESFVNSAFILQGRADEFTRQTPGKRKDILASLLGLEQFSRLQEKARQMARSFDERAEFRDGDLKRYEAEIASQAEYESALERAFAEVGRLERLLANALPTSGAPAVSGSMLLHRVTVSLPFVMHVTPVLVPQSDFGARHVAALVLIVEPGNASRIAPPLVAALLGLTPVESQIAVWLAEGKTVHDIATATGRTKSSVYWHLKQIYRKRGITRQVDLVRLVLSLAVFA